MRLAISNIAWSPHDTADVYAVLKALGVRALEIAPRLFLPDEPDPFRPSAEACRLTLSKAESAGLVLVSMQSLLFGVEGALLFGHGAQRETFVAAMRRSIDLAERLGVPHLVVGSPKNRVIPDGIDHAVAFREAATVFRRLGDYAIARGCVLAMEPNPALYGTNFLTHVSDTYQFVCQTNHPGITLNFDTGSLHINDEFGDLPRLFAMARDRVSHVHLSEANLAPVPGDPAKLDMLFRALRSQGWDKWVSIEMRGVASGAVAHVRRTVESCLTSMGRI